MSRRVLQLALTAVAAMYPIIVWLGQDRVEPRVLAVILLLLVMTRLQALKISPTLGWLGAGALVFQLCILWAAPRIAVKLYPFFVNSLLLWLFAYSLWIPPPIIECWARRSEADLPPSAIAYTRRVTQVWCIFFALNGAVAFITAVWASAAIWTLYNGMIAYLLMGLLFAGEYCVRQRFKRVQRG